MKNFPRVALFSDSFDQTTGVAQITRQFVRFAKKRSLPILCVNGGTATNWSHDKLFSHLEIKRSFVAIPLGNDLTSDLFLWRHYRDVCKIVKNFSPDIIHVTGSGDIGKLGASIARQLGVPLVASWHNNIHQYAAHRLGHWLPFEAPQMQQRFEELTLRLTLQFYQRVKVLLAPNEELQKLLQTRTGKPVFLMKRGVNIEKFSPAHRFRLENKFQLGYVGRLQPEKNLRALLQVEEKLIQQNISNYQFVIVGSGSEQGWLNQRLQQAVFPGNLSGQSLARAYANFDLFLFPSQTDAFGNVVLEALASGVPAIVMSGGGPKFIVEPKQNGFVANNDNEFADITVQMIDEMANPLRCQNLREAARAHALTFSWENVFEQVYEAYEACFSTQEILTIESSMAIPISTSRIRKP